MGTWNGQTRANAEVTYSGSLRHSLAKRYTSELETNLNLFRFFDLKPGGCRTLVRKVQWSHWLSLRRREKQTHGAELVKRWCSWWSWKLGCQNIWLTQLPPGDREGAENLGSRAEVWDFWWDGRGQVLLEGAGRGQVCLVRAGWGQVLLDETEHYHCHIIHAPGFSMPIHKLISCSSITPPTCHNIHEMRKRNRTWRKSKCDSPPINLIFVKSFHVVVENSCDPSKPVANSLNYLRCGHHACVTALNCRGH